MSEKKRVNEISIDDFIKNPIWTWEEDDGDVLIPIKYNDRLPDNYNALFVKSEFTLRDKTKVTGVVCVRLSDHNIYLLEFSDGNKGILQLPLQSKFIKILQQRKNKFSQLLGKPQEMIFPLTFNTPYLFIDGTKLEGTIDV
jgi:hypothetical protein